MIWHIDHKIIQIWLRDFSESFSVTIKHGENPTSQTKILWKTMDAVYMDKPGILKKCAAVKDVATYNVCR